MTSQIVEAEELLQPFFRKLNRRDRIGPEEQRALAEAAEDRLVYAAGEDLVVEGERPTRSMLVTSGFTCRYRTLPDGQRQLTAIHLPGDFVDLHSFLLKEMDHSVGALSPTTIITFPHERLVKLTERFPHLTRLLWLLTLLDGSTHREWLVGMGRLSAQERVAHLFCEVYARLSSIGFASDYRFNLPITQAALADAVGISTVHVNRVLQELRMGGYISWDGGQLVIQDWDRLVALAQFNDRYLHLVQEPR
ncbi:cAMP-binding domain of CRP or a regulatory subunit of cAMP-dependent protein kinases [Devosia sp. YR412]|uniref:Crp/Fnr family transcriptional regulator n=1 Tax=Devosia sp. YR412 TaxID=1881030 RepID=UPI0008B27BC6|nr:Crp/Fnr family transcriptional regulator [Devosia sp. YR412]SEP65284.1 cAMP-binding domain of CRP or a regulatory subunit of cAMP-dependent protein kinases [Devosia sp. YR412]